MVYLHFPTNLTEEEIMLQAKYQKLRRKKKAVQAMKTPKPEAEPRNLKRRPEAMDAKEVAKKLLKSGAISAIPKLADKGEKAFFKRSKGLERKLSGTDRSTDRLGFQPYSATHPQEEERDKKQPPKKLYDKFVTARDKEERGLTETREGKPDKPRKGNTIYVYGFRITEEMLYEVFGKFGKIANVSMEVEKNCGFVTFEKSESADKAILESNGMEFHGTQLKVDLARRQPVIDPINDASASCTWSTIAASHSQKGSHKDKRNMLVYDEDLFD